MECPAAVVPAAIMSITIDEVVDVVGGENASATETNIMIMVNDFIIVPLCFVVTLVPTVLSRYVRIHKYVHNLWYMDILVS